MQLSCKRAMRQLLVMLMAESSATLQGHLVCSGVSNMGMVLHDSRIGVEQWASCF